MQPRNWLLLAIGSAAVIGGAAVALNLSLDPWGLYRDPASRKLPVYGDSRVGKYLLSTRYVPANFSGILIGSSMTANWSLSLLKQARVYNESLTGGDVTEEKAVAERALSRPGIEVAFLVQDPYFTLEHEFKTVSLGPQLWLSSLGSDSLLSVYKDMLRQRLGQPTASIDSNGTEHFDHLPSKLNSTLQRLWQPGTPFPIDPAAVAAYRDLVALLHRQHVQIIFLIPPVFEGISQAKTEAISQYALTFADLRQPGDLLIDLCSGEYRDFCARRENFADGIHLVSGAADQIVSRIGRQLDDWIAQGRLHLKASHER
jgi:hypothetical protein